MYANFAKPEKISYLVDMLNFTDFSVDGFSPTVYYARDTLQHRISDEPQPR
jgi:hypothetical protein